MPIQKHLKKSLIERNFKLDVAEMSYFTDINAYKEKLSATCENAIKEKINVRQSI